MRLFFKYRYIVWLHLSKGGRVNNLPAIMFSNDHKELLENGNN